MCVWWLPVTQQSLIPRLNVYDEVGGLGDEDGGDNDGSSLQGRTCH